MANQSLTKSILYNDRHASVNKNIQLTIAECLRRFAMHILPHRLVRIRLYGILRYHARANIIKEIQEFDPPNIKITTRPIFDANRCKVYKSDEMITTILQKQKSRSP